MPRSYDVRTSALATQTSVKWIDNLLSHNRLPGVAHGKQGVERRVSDEGLLAIEIVRRLNEELGVPLSRAISVAHTALATRNGGAAILELASGVTLVFDLVTIERKLHNHVVSAMESVGRVARGRPRRNTLT